MCDPVIGLAIAAAVVTGYGQIQAGQAANAQSKYEQKLANRNAEMEDRNRKDAISRGDTEQMRHYRKLAQAMGEARVKAGAAGVDVAFGSAANLESDIALMGYEDSATISENTVKEMEGYDINAANYRAEGKAARMRGKAAKTAGYIGAAGTLLSAGSQLASMPKKAA